MPSPTLRRQAEAAVELRLRALGRRHAADPYSWFLERVRLLDPLAAAGAQIAPYPAFPYTQALIAEAYGHPRQLWWKSRRMIASWTAIGKAVHICTHLPNQRCFFIKDKEGEDDTQGSREMVWRAGWLIRNLRGEGVDPRAEIGKLHIRFGNGSTITGVSSNPNVLRGLPANYAVGDEMAVWERPLESLAALLPSLEARGSYIGISSAAAGYFDLLVHDQDESAWEAASRATARRDIERPDDAFEILDYDLPGFMAWTNRRNGFRILRIHYTADPRKRSDEWKAREKAGMPNSIWEQEYEIRARVHSGRAVFFHEWDAARMLLKRIPLDAGRPLWSNLDFGYNHPAGTLHQVRGGRIFTVYRGLLGDYVPFRTFMRQWLTLMGEWYPGRSTDPESGDYRWTCDAAGTQQNPEGLPEVTILKREFGIRPKFKKSDINPTLDILRGYMARVWRGAPEFQVERNPDTLMIQEALGGGYRFPLAKPGKAEAENPEDDGIYIHLMDTLRYGALHSDPTKWRGRETASKIASADILPRRNYVIH